MVPSFRSVEHKSKSGLISVATNIWTIEADECICYRPPIQPKYPYTIRTVIIRLDDDSLFVISPITLNQEIQNDIDRLGAVKYLVSPNQIHHLYLDEWSNAYPSAKIYASPGLASKRKDLNFAKTITTNIPEPEWKDQIEQSIFGRGTGWFDEVVFFHRASGTIIFTDLIMDFEQDSFSPLAQVTTELNQMYKHTPRGLQLIHMFDKNYLRDSFETFLNWQPQRVIVAHSPWLCVESVEEVTDFLHYAFDWLKPKPAMIEFVIGLFKLLLFIFLIVPIHFLVVLIGDIIYPTTIKAIVPQTPAINKNS